MLRFVKKPKKMQPPSILVWFPFENVTRVYCMRYAGALHTKHGLVSHARLTLAIGRAARAIQRQHLNICTVDDRQRAPKCVRVLRVGIHRIACHDVVGQHNAIPMATGDRGSDDYPIGECR